MYPFNPQQLLESNKIPSEMHSLSPANSVPFRLIMPTYSPFYRDGLIVTSSGVTLTEGIDYYLTHKFATATHTTAKPIFGTIYIVNELLAGNISVVYDTLGGDYLFNALTGTAPTEDVDPTSLYWENVIGDLAFPPVDILFDIEKDEWQGEAELNTAIDLVADSISGRDPTESELHILLVDRIERLEAIWEDAQAIAHMADKGNPHGTTAWQARALDLNANAYDTVLAFGKGLQELADYVNTIVLDRAELLKYVKLASANSMGGSIQFRDGQFSLIASDGSAGVYFTGSAVNLIAVNNVIIEAGDEGSFTLNVGDQCLTLAHDDVARFNDIAIATVANSAQLTEDSIDVDRLKVVTLDSDTLTWEGNGFVATPLIANIITTRAADSVYGVTKLATKSMTLNDPTLASTPWHVNSLTELINDKVDGDITVNDKLLSSNPILYKGDKYIGLSNVNNISDEDMPLSNDMLVSLEDKSLGTHVHDSSDVELPLAGEDTKGIGFISTIPEEGVTDRAITRITEETMSTALIAAKARAESLFPIGILDINAYGDDTYFPAPVTGSFTNQVSYGRSWPMLVENGYLTFLRLGRDQNGSGLMLSYGELDADGGVNSIINTVTEYTPGFIPTGYEINHVNGGCIDYFTIRVINASGDIRYFLVRTNGTMDQSKHDSVEVDLSGFTDSAYSSIGFYNNAIYVFNFSSKIFYKIVVTDTSFDSTPSVMPFAEDLIPSIVGKNIWGTNISEDFFYGSPISNDESDHPIVYIADDYYTGWSLRGLSLVTSIINGVLYFKYSRDAWTYNSDRRMVVDTSMSYMINLNTFTATLMPGQNLPTLVTEDSVTSDFDDVSRSTLFGTHISALGGSSSQHAAHTIINNIMYAVAIHIGDTGISSIANSYSDLEYDHFDVTTLDLDNANATVNFGDGASYDGYTKPFGGTAIGPAIDGYPTIIAACQYNSNIFWAQTAGWGDVGFIPAGFRKKITDTQWNECAIFTFPVIGTGGLYKSYDGVRITSDELTGNIVPTIVNDELVAGTEYTLPASDSALLDIEFSNILLLNTHITDILSIKWELFICPTINIVLAIAVAIDSQGNGTTAIISLDSSNWSLKSGVVLMASVSGSQFLDSYNRSVGSLYYNTIHRTTIRSQSFIHDSDDGDQSIAIMSRYTTVAVSAANYPNTRFLLYHKDGLYTVGNKSSSYYWTANHWAPGEDGRPMWAHQNSSLSGVELRDVYEDNLAIRDSSTTSGYDVYNFMTTLHDESWNVSFYAEKRLIVNGTEYTMPISNFDLSTLTNYKNITLYLFAELVDGEPTYNFYDSPSSTYAGVMIGEVITNDTNIISINIDYNVSVGMFRELEEHIADYDDPHNLVGSDATSVGLGELSNYPLRHYITELNFSDIFNDWYRFSHRATAPGVYPAIESETLTWLYVESLDLIYTNKNSLSFIGFVSDLSYGDYEFNTTLQCYYGGTTDNDCMVVVIAFIIVDGIEHTLSVIRSGEHYAYGWLYVYNSFSVWYNYDQSDMVEIVSTGELDYIDSGAWGTRSTDVYVIREGNTWSIKTTAMVSGGSDITASLAVDIADYPILEVFIGSVQIGYGAKSQAGSSFINNRRPDTDVDSSYASQNMIQEVMTNAIKGPTVIFGTVDAGEVVPIPAGYTTDQCTVVPLLNKFTAPNGFSVSGWDCKDIDGNGSLRYRIYTDDPDTDYHEYATIDYILYAG